MRIRHWAQDCWKHKYLLAMLAPCLLYFIVFKYMPIYGLILAFKQYRFMDGFFGSPWVGFDNFAQLFGGMGFSRALRNTLILSMYKLAFGFPAPIVLALLLNELRSALYKRFVQSLSYLPHFISWVVLAGILMEVFSPSRGIVNAVIGLFGVEPIYFFGDSSVFRGLLVSTGIWQSIGWGSIIYIAALSAIDPSLYEAAIMDGAGRFKRAIHIALPSLVPVITIMLIFAVGGIINDDFDQIFNFYNPAVYSVADVLSTYTYRVGVEEMQYGLATASGVFINVISFLLVVGTNTFIRRYSDYGIW